MKFVPQTDVEKSPFFSPNYNRWGAVASVDHQGATGRSFRINVRPCFLAGQRRRIKK